MDEEVECACSLKGKVLEVWKGQGGGTAWPIIAEMLPQKLLCELDANGLPPAERSYAISFENGLVASPTGTLQCLCFTGRAHLSLGFGPFALHLYGQPGDWTLHEGPGDEPTFARFPGTKCICFSIYKWGDYPYYEACNIFERCREYDRDFSVGGLDKVVVRMARDVVGKVCKAFEQCQWPKARDVVEFRLWDFADMSLDDAVEREFIDGTWYDWIDQPEVLGPKVSIENLRLSVNSG